VTSMIRRALALRMSAPDSTIRLLKEAIAFSAQGRYPEGVIKALIPLGNTYSRIGKHQEALAVFQDAALRAIRNNQLKYLTKIYSLETHVYRTLGDYEQAVRSCHRALLFSDQQDSTGRVKASIYNDLATVLIQLDRTDQALYYLEKAEALAREKKDSVLLISVLGHKGNFHGKLKEWDKSKQYLQTSVELARKGLKGVLPETTYELEGAALCNLGYAYLLQDQPTQALVYLKEAAALSDKVGVYLGNHLWLMLGLAYSGLDNYREAESYLLKANENATRLNLTNDRLQSYMMLGNLYAATHRHEKAFALQKRYIALKDSIENQEIIRNITAWETRYRTAEKDKELMRSQLRIAQQDKHLAIQRNWIISISAAAMICVILFIAIYRNNLHRQRLQAEKIINLQQQQEITELKATIQGAEQERKRIAVELHDGIGGLLAAAKMNFMAFRRQFREIAGSEDFRDGLNLLSEASGELRKTAHNLKPDGLLREGLVNAVRVFCSQLAKGYNLHIDVSTYGNVELGNADFELSIFRIIQELVHNIVKHADATQAQVRLSMHDHLLQIGVVDNGRGIAENVSCQGTGIGLSNIRARVRAAGGRMSLSSNAGAGTAVYLEFEIGTEAPVGNAEL
jgi:two-component system NarL family sensor kinase